MKKRFLRGAALLFALIIVGALGACGTGGAETKEVPVPQEVEALADPGRRTPTFWCRWTPGHPG